MICARDVLNTAAGRLTERLRGEFGRGAVGHIAAQMSDDDLATIRRQLNDCQILLVLIDPSWTSVRNTQGQRLIDDPADPIRIAIEEAIDRDLWVVPVLVNGAAPLTASELPPTLRSLAGRLPGVLREDPDFERDVRRLILTLAPRLRLRPRDLPRWAYVAGIVLLLALVVGNIVARVSPAAAGPRPTPGALAATYTPAPTPTPVPVPYTGNDFLNSISVSADGTVGWIVGADMLDVGVFAHEVNGHWLEYPQASATYGVQHVTTVSNNEAWAVGDHGAIFHYLNGYWDGEFNSIANAENAQLLDLAIISPNEIWAVGGDSNTSAVQQSPAQFWHEQNGVWTAFDNSFNAYVHSIAMAPGGASGWAVGAELPLNSSGNLALGRGHIFRFAHGIWSEVNVPNLPGLLSVTMSADGLQGWAAGVGAALWHYAYGAWSPVALPLTDPSTVIQALGAVTPTNIWGVGNKGVIIHYNGTSWSQVASPVTTDLTSVAMLSATEGWIATASGRLLHYDGTQWTEAPSPTTGFLTSLSMITPTDGWVIANGNMLHYDGISWQVAANTGFYAPKNVATLPDGEAWANGIAPSSANDPNSAQIYHEQGGTWSPVAGTGKAALGDITGSVIAVQSPTNGWLIVDNFATVVREANGVWRPAKAGN